MKARTKQRHSSEPHIYENVIKTDCADKRTAVGILVWRLIFTTFQDFGLLLMMMMMMMMISIGLSQA
jgi:hypothetical protein